MSVLKVENLVAGYGSITALKGISLHVEKGEIATLIGANGAGKTTLLNTISGLIPAREGTITFDGEDITRLPSDKIVRKGIVQVPEGRQIFSELSVLDNLKMGAYVRDKKDDYTPELERAFATFPVLKERMHQKGGSLSGGEQQMLAVARALMSKPKLLLLDEPSMGLAPVIVEEIFRTIEEINKQGMTILLIEQDAMLALKVADRAYVIETGTVALEGKASDLIHDERVRDVYLGG
jgi:branched-chain amino acid transport system ATP-binding protein